MAKSLPARAIRLVFVGGALGSVARYLVGLQFITPITLLVVNLLGAAFIGYINGAPAGSRLATQENRWFWATGFAGGFTTMSGLALAFVLLDGVIGGLAAAAYLLLQMMLGLALYSLVYRLRQGAWPRV